MNGGVPHVEPTNRHRAVARARAIRRLDGYALLPIVTIGVVVLTLPAYLATMQAHIFDLSLFSSICTGPRL